MIRAIVFDMDGVVPGTECLHQAVEHLILTPEALARP